LLALRRLCTSMLKVSTGAKGGESATCAAKRRVQLDATYNVALFPQNTPLPLKTQSGHGTSMKSGILRADEGYDIFVGGQVRTFRDLESIAYEAARLLKSASKYKEGVEIVVRATGQRIEIAGDGRGA
jgi:hypothetical protein